MSTAVGAEEWIVSVDDHVIEPPDLWVRRAPSNQRDRVPRVETGDDGLVYWVFDQFRTPIAQTVVEPGQKGSPLGQFVRSYDELNPAYYDPTAPLKPPIAIAPCSVFSPRTIG